MTSTEGQDRGRDIIRNLIDKYASMSNEDRKSMTEASVVHQFLDPFLEALGWPIKDPARYKYEHNMQAGRPDMILIPEKAGVIFVEAKRFGMIEDFELAQRMNALAPGQLSLPGMATDRTKEEQQAINYAFENNGTWAILTNFEKLRLFNARRDWLVLSFSTPGAFLEQFDLLWQLSYENVCKGSLDALSNQRYREDVDIDYLNFINEWREKLAKDIIARPESNKWAIAPDGRINLVALRSVVQRILDRLVVVRFAEDHLVAPAGTLYSLYELRKSNPYTYTLGQMVRQLYRRFDEDHNSALFAPDLTDEVVFSDEVLSGLIQKLYEARYRAMSADIMGNTYEQYLGKTLAQKNGDVTTVDNLETRKKQGSYYTPPAIVRYLVDNSLGRYLYGTANGQPDGELLPNEKPKTGSDINKLRVLDPACGSGSFLIYGYEVLANFYRREIRRLEEECEKLYQELVTKGVTKPFDLKIELTPLTTELERLRDYPRIILQTHLYGVDLDPQAAEIATVNLIMRAMADQHRMEKRLPLILNQNVKVGNSLIGAGASDSRYGDHANDLAEIRRLRLLLANKNGTSDHAKILKDIGQIAGLVNSVLEKELSEHFEDVNSHKPFNWAVEFPEVFLDGQGKYGEDSAGFDVVVGNPPWEILKPDLREFYAQFDPDIENRLTRSQADRRIADLNEEDPSRQVAWQAQRAKIEEAAACLHSSTDYIHQGQGDTATHKLFLERGYGLLNHKGRLGYVIPSGIYTDLGTQQLREMLLREGQIQYLFSFSNERFFFPHVDHRVKFTLLGAQKGTQSEGFRATFRFNPRVAVAPKELATFLNNPANLIYVQHNSLKRFSPLSLSVMEFQNQRDVNVLEKIYGDRPSIGTLMPNKWNIRFTREIDNTTDMVMLNEHGVGAPLHEGKMVNQYDFRYRENQYWIDISSARAKLLQHSSTQGRIGADLYRVVNRRQARSTDIRTMIACIIPPGTFCWDNLAVTTMWNEHGVQLLGCPHLCYLVAIMNSFVFDFTLRLQIGTNLSFYIIYQLPMPRLVRGNPYFDAIVFRAARLTCTCQEFAELWQEVMNETWDKSKGATTEGERQVLRDEIDVLVAHLYGLSRDDFSHILNSFPLVFPGSDAGKSKKDALLATFDDFTRLVAAWDKQE